MIPFNPLGFVLGKTNERDVEEKILSMGLVIEIRIPLGPYSKNNKDYSGIGFSPPEKPPFYFFNIPVPPEKLHLEFFKKTLTAIRFIYPSNKRISLDFYSRVEKELSDYFPFAVDPSPSDFTEPETCHFRTNHDNVMLLRREDDFLEILVQDGEHALKLIKKRDI